MQIYTHGSEPRSLQGMHMLDSSGELWMPRDRPAHMGGMLAPTGLDIHTQKHPRYISEGHMGMVAYDPPPSPRDIFQGLSPHHADGVGLKVVVYSPVLRQQGSV